VFVGIKKFMWIGGEIIFILFLISFVLWRYTSVFNDFKNLKTISKKRSISLTMDVYAVDYFSDYLDIIDNANQPITLFFTANLLEQINKDNPELIQRIKDMKNSGLIEIGQASDIYVSLNGLPESIIRVRLQKATVVIENILGFTPQYLHPPLDEFNPVIIKIAHELNLQIIQSDRRPLPDGFSRFMKTDLIEYVETFSNNTIIHFNDEKKSLKLLLSYFQYFKESDFDLKILSVLKKQANNEIVNFNSNYYEKWKHYASNDSILEYQVNDKDMEIVYRGGVNDWAGIYKNIQAFNRDWSKYDGLVIEVFGTNTLKKYTIAIADDGNERWYAEFIDNWNGWKSFYIAFSSFQVSDAFLGEFVSDNFLGLNYVRQIHITPLEGESLIRLRKIFLQ